MKQNLLFNQASAIGKRIAMVLTMLLIVGIGQAWGAGTETFENAASSTSYGSVSWKGVNGLQWSASSFRTDQKISGNRGLTSKASTACTITMPLTSVQQSEGMGVFTFKYKYPYSDSGKKNNLSFTINGNTYTGTVSYNSNAQTVNITVNQSNLPATITINIASGGRACFDDFSWTSYVSADPYTVTLKDDNSTLTQSSAGESVTLPPRNGCDGYTFVGWTKSWSVAQTTWTTTAPTIIPAGSYTPTANENLYPVYTKNEGGGSTEYVLTDISAIAPGDVFVFADASNYALTNNNGTSSAIGVKSITVSNNKVTSTVDATIKWQLTGNDTEGYTFYPSSGTSTWLYCNTTANSSSNNNMRVGTGNRKLFVVNDNGYLVTNDTHTDRYLSRYEESGTPKDFRGYVNTNTNPVKPKLYKETSGSTTSYISVTDCTTETAGYLHANTQTDNVIFDILI